MGVEASAWLDPLSSGALQRELPVIRTAFDAEAMRTHLEAALIGPQGPARLRRCRPAQAIFLDGECCVVRYELDVEDASGWLRPTLVTGRFYADPGRAAAYAAQRLPPLVARVRGRPEVAPFAVPAVCIDALGMVAQVFPIDGELPTLVEATDPAVAARVLADMLAAGGHADTEVLACRVEPVHYNRRHRCMSRYHLDLAGHRRMVLYGKVSNDGVGARTPGVVDELRATLYGARFALPECLGFQEDLQLVVFTEIPGVPQVAQLLRARLRGESPAVTGLMLEEAVEACGRIAAALHGCGLRRGAARPLEGELVRLRGELAPIRRLSPELGERLTRWLDHQEAAAATTDALPLCPSHGDFTYTQLIFEGPRGGLVDFDTFCQAEPALDLGHFLAYMRFAQAKARAVNSAVDPAELIERLAARFTAAYTTAGGDAAALERVALYEALGLIRQAAHAWQNLKGARLEHLLTVLAERVPPTSLQQRRGDGLQRLAGMPDWLAVFDDPARVEAAFREAVPGLRVATLGAVRLKQQAWTARCELVLAGQEGGDRVRYFSGTIVPPGQPQPPGTPPSAVGLVDGGPGWLPALRLALTPEQRAETKLPALALLTDPEQARALLEQAIRSGAPAYRDLRILGCEPQMMRYTPGSRATIRYWLDLPPEGHAACWPDVVVAKTYHRQDKGDTAWEGMQALWRSSLGRSTTVAIAEPLAWMPEQKMLVQGPIRQDQTLKDLLLQALATDDATTWARLHGYLAKTTDGLVELHHCGAPSARHVTWNDELTEVREVLSRVTARLPELAGAADEFLDRVERIAGQVPADPAGPAHRSFRPAQVLLHADEIGFIDFDGFCQAEPALDVALFRATLRDLGMGTLSRHTSPAACQARVEQLDALCDEFLDRYQARSRISPQRVAVWEALDLLTNVLDAWTKAKPVRLEHGLTLLHNHAKRLGPRTEGDRAYRIRAGADVGTGRM